MRIITKYADIPYDNRVLFIRIEEKGASLYAESLSPRRLNGVIIKKCKSYEEANKLMNDIVKASKFNTKVYYVDKETEF